MPLFHTVAIFHSRHTCCVHMQLLGQGQPRGLADVHEQVLALKQAAFTRFHTLDSEWVLQLLIIIHFD